MRRYVSVGVLKTTAVSNYNDNASNYFRLHNFDQF